MSSAERRFARAGLCLALVLLAGACQVRPLYAPSPSGDSPQASLPAIQLETPATRIEQVFRNEVSFLATGGGGAAAPAYRLDYNLSTGQTPLGVQVATGVPTTYQVSGTVSYSLLSGDGDTVLLTETAATVTSLDRSSQNFANIRAFRDAEDRIAQDLARRVTRRLAVYFATR